jgi:hypothetical protein
LLAIGATARRASADSRRLDVVVEIDAESDRLLDARLTRRLIGLEIKEVDVPAPPTVVPSTPERSLFVRVLGDTGHRLRVELWEHGVFHGVRVVTVTPGGSRYLRAQRIALVAAELARRLRQERVRQVREQEHARSRTGLAAPGAATALVSPRARLHAAGLGALVGPGDLGVAGPRLGGELVLPGRAKVELGAAWLFGVASGVPGSARAQWLELSLTPGYSATLSRRFDLYLGLRVAAAAVHLTGISGFDRIPGEHDTWSARAVGELGLEYRLTPEFGLRGGPEFGSVLRRMVVTDRLGTDHRLGGIWLGLALGITLDPAAPRARQQTQPGPAGAGHATGSRSGPPL